MREINEKAYNQGYSAFKEHFSILDNPYKYNPCDQEDWDTGYMDAHRGDPNHYPE